MASLPPLAPFPRASWRQHLSSSEWDALLETWLTICQAYLALSDTDLSKKADENDSLPTFLLTFTEETAESGPSVLGSHSIALLKFTFQLISRLFSASPPTSLLSFGFLSGVSKIYPKKRTAALLAQVFETQGAAVEASLSAIKKRLIPQLDAGIKGDLRDVESKLLQLNPLLHVSSHACTLFLAGSDFFDGLITCFRVMNPPLRKAIITTIYLCLVGLTEAQPPKWAMLNDQLYSLKAAADTHKAGPLNANDSLVAELVTSTPILRILSRRAEEGNAASDNFKSRVTALQGYKKGPMVRPKKLIKRKVDKGKGKMSQQDADADMHIHKMSLVTQVQDLFPDLGAGFIMKCLDEYGDDVEQVVANLLSDSLPPHLSDVDRSEPLYVLSDLQRRAMLTHSRTTNPTSQSKTDLAPHSTPPLVPTRRNIYDDDDFDRLSMDVSKLSFGKRPGKTADQMLADKSAAPGKAAILSALAAFDSDDDERDDTYDAADVGGTVDGSNQETDGVSDGNEQVLYRAYQMDEKVFDRDATTRRGPARARLRDETGMTDETIEGWAVMLARNPQQKRRLEAKYAFSGEQAQIERTSWRASAGSGAEESDPDGGASRGGRGGGRGRGRGRGRGGQGRGGGNVAGPTGDKDTEAARRRKEANKGSRANHNRREGRARKMARGFGS